MPPDFSRFFDQANVDFAFLLDGKLLEADCCPKQEAGLYDVSPGATEVG